MGVLNIKNFKNIQKYGSKGMFGLCPIELKNKIRKSNLDIGEAKFLDY